MAARGRKCGRRCLLLMTTTCESSPEAAGERVHCEAASQLLRRGLARGERISACCTSARRNEEVALESTAGRSPTPVRTSRRWPARIPVVFEESVKLKVTRRRPKLTKEVTWKNHHKAEANCPVRASN